MSTEDIWTKEELKALSLAHKRFKHKMEIFSNKKKIWTSISEELENAGFSKDAWECEQRWNILQKSNNNVADSSEDVEVNMDHLNKNQGKYYLLFYITIFLCCQRA